VDPEELEQLVNDEILLQREWDAIPDIPPAGCKYGWLYIEGEMSEDVAIYETNTGGHAAVDEVTDSKAKRLFGVKYFVGFVTRCIRSATSE